MYIHFKKKKWCLHVSKWQEDNRKSQSMWTCKDIGWIYAIITNFKNRRWIRLISKQGNHEKSSLKWKTVLFQSSERLGKQNPDILIGSRSKSNSTRLTFLLIVVNIFNKFAVEFKKNVLFKKLNGNGRINTINISYMSKSWTVLRMNANMST